MRILQLVGAILILLASPAMAKDVSAWTVTQKSGDVQVLKRGLQPASVQIRTALSPGDIVATGANGRAVLTRGDDYVVVAPGSRLLLPHEEKKTGFTRLIQQVGTMLYKVRHTGVPHFAVETPMLAAVVKGTTFTVVVDKDRAAVQVTEGAVEVSALTGEARRLVERGITVYIGRERPNDIIEMKPGAVDLPGSSEKSVTVKIERSGDVPLSAITKLTGGLVREVPSAAVVASNSTPIANAPVPAPQEPTAEIGETKAPSVVEPVADVVEATVPTVTEPVVDLVETAVPSVTEPVIDLVEATVPDVETVVEIVDTTVPTVTEPIVDLVDAIIPTELDNSGPGGGGSDNSGPGSDNSGPGGGDFDSSGPGSGGLVETITEPVGDVINGLLGS